MNVLVLFFFLRSFLFLDGPNEAWKCSQQREAFFFSSFFLLLVPDLVEEASKLDQSRADLDHSSALKGLKM